MKRTKRIASVLLALVMALSLITTAFAAGETGSITIDNAVVGQTYTIYQILDLESYNKDSGAYAYKATAAWRDFINGADVKSVYVNVDAQGYVTWVKDADVAAFAKLAQKYAADHNIANQGTKTADSTTVEFTNLDLGYYLVDSTLGTICSLDTTNPSVTIKEKNSKPTVDKQVQENSNSNWGDTNDANIGDTVNFKTTINVVDGQPKNYVLHDKMSNGLTFDAGSVEVKIGDRTLTLGSDYTLIANPKDGCTFEIEFKENVLKPNDVVIVTYSATLNDKAVIAGEGNPNETHLTYGDNSHTEKDTTRTYTWQMDVLKYTMKDNKETPLAGAKFVLYKTVDGKTLYARADENNKITGWTENEGDATVFETPDNGQFSIIGLDAGTYYLKEIEAPAGYNMLKDPIEVVITATVDGTTNTRTATVTYNKTSTGTVKVENKTGAELPSTGGIGTTIFYVVGGLLVVAAGVLLVTRKRMSKSED